MSIPITDGDEIQALRWLRSIIESLPTMPTTKQRPAAETFGQRLARIRKARGLSQRELARRLDATQRVVAYYEGQTEHAPAHMLSDLARVLAVSVDQLLGAKPVRSEPVDIDVRLLRRIQEIQRLPPSTKRAVLKVIDELLGRHTGRHVDDNAA